MRSEKMARLAVIVYIFSICFIKCIEGQNFPINPCPDLFRYESNGTRYQGAITLRNPPAYGTSFTVKVIMVIDVSLSKDNLGSLELGQSTAESGQLVKRGQPLRYRLEFPIANEIPRIIQIKVEDETLCSAEEGYEITTITLDNTLQTGIRVNIPGPGRVPENRNRFTTLPPPSDDSCGREVTKVGKNIHFGAKIERGDWPWLVAILRKDVSNDEYICGGTLISRTVVVTAAHCMFVNSQEVDKNDLLIIVGANDLDDVFKEDVQNMEVLSIKVHVEYSNKTLLNDIAIIKTKERVKYDDNVKPACLWSGKDDQSLVIGKSGNVAGWGLDENKKLLTDGARIVSGSIVELTYCRGTNQDFFPITSNKTLCAGDQNKTGPCQGDSGSGLLVKRNKRWELRGIVSSSRRSETIVCDLSYYVVYTDVAKYGQWIKQEMESN